MYDVIIIGAGPAGMTAGIYAARAGHKAVIIEKNPMSGGQMATTYEVNNYPGLPGIDGADLAMKMHEHARKAGAVFAVEQVLSAELENRIKVVKTKENIYEAKAVIIAVGTAHAKLGIPGEKELTGMGVSYCATCDGAFFRNKTVAVVGGGDVAVEDAIYLSGICKKVYLIHRRDSLRAAHALQEKLQGIENVEIIWNTVTEKICGETCVTGVQIRNVNDNRRQELELQGVFVAIGIRPETELFRGMVDMDENGYIHAGENGRTSLDCVYAVGDAREKRLRQIVTAVADGANAVCSLGEDLKKLQMK